MPVSRLALWTTIVLAPALSLVEAPQPRVNHDDSGNHTLWLNPKHIFRETDDPVWSSRSGPRPITEEDESNGFQRSAVESYPDGFRRSMRLRDELHASHAYWSTGEEPRFFRGDVEALPLPYAEPFSYGNGGLLEAVIEDLVDTEEGPVVSFQRGDVEAVVPPSIYSQVKQTSAYESGASPRVVCYVTNWSWHRSGDAKYAPEFIDSKRCSHIVYAFAGLEPSSLQLRPLDPRADIENRLYQRTTALKQSNPSLKVLLAMGGWTDSSGDKYSRLVNNPQLRRQFISQAVDFLVQQEFDGLSVEWNYPKCWQSDCRKGPASDRSAYAQFLRELKAEMTLRSPPLLLAVGVSGYREVLEEGYDLAAISRAVDWMTLSAYDFHGSWEGVTGHSAPLRPRQGEATPHYNVESVVQYVLQQGAEKGKIVVGIPLYGQSFTLADPSKTKLGSPTSGPGRPGPFTQQSGMLSFSEICYKERTDGWWKVKDPSGQNGPYLYKDNQWVGYDDLEFIQTKVRFIQSNGLGGAALWTLDLDDFQNKCCRGPSPVVHLVAREMALPGVPPLPGHDCSPPSTPPTPPTVPMTTPEEAGTRPPTPWTSTTPSTTTSWWTSTTPSTTTNWWTSPTTSSWWTPSTTTTRATTTTSPTTTTTTTTTTKRPLTTWRPQTTTGSSDSLRPGTPCDGWIIRPIPGNCAAYVRCVNGHVLREDCPGGLHFDPNLNSCDWPHKVMCHIQVTSPTTAAPTPPPTTETTTRPTFTTVFTTRPTMAVTTPTTTTVFVPQPEEELPAPGQRCRDWDYKRDRDQCDVYYRCIHGFTHVERCNAGLHFNPEMSGCDWPKGPCRPIGMSTTMRPITQWTEPTTSPPIHWTSSTNSEIEGEMDVEVMSDRCSGWLYNPSLTGNCNEYLMCVMGRVEKRICSPGLHWNQDRTMCDWPTSAGCRGDREPGGGMGTPSTTATSEFTTSRTSTPYPEEGCQTGSYYPVPSDCQSYYLCVDRKPHRMSCPPGLHWDQMRVLCDWPMRAQCQLRRSRAVLFVRLPLLNSVTPFWWNGEKVHRPKIGCQDGAYSPNPQDCGSYLLCVYGDFVQFKCQEGLHWNNVLRNCDWPEQASCPLEPGSVTVGTAGPATTESWEKPTTTSWSKPTAPSWSKPPPTSWSKPTTPSTPITVATVEPGIVGSSGTLSGDYKLVCYFTNWAWYRPGKGKYTPDNIDATLCTHIVYGFAVLNYDSLTIRAHDSWADFDNKFYEKVTAYKSKGIKVLLAIGGWNDSAGDKYSRLVNSPASRARFIKHVLEYLEKHNFDGLDLDWEYPKCWQVDCKKGPDSDKPAFASFLRELSAEFRPRGLLLTSAVSPSKTVVDAGYDVPALNKYLDWIAVMTYDFHGHWDKKTGHVAPLYGHPDDDFYFFNANYSIHYWIWKGASASKIVMGMPMYGQSFTLTKPSENGLNAPSTGPGQAGQQTRAAGFLAYYEICQKVQQEGYTVVKDPHGRMGPFAYKDRQWFSFDDAETIRKKSEFIRSLGLAGGMIWALDLDDFRGTCGNGPHPLLNTIVQVLGPPRKAGEAGVAVVTPPPGPAPVTSPSVTDLALPGPGTDSSVAPVGPSSSSPYKVVCYFTNWAWYRQGLGKYKPSDIDASLCTHIVYGFAVLNGESLTIRAHDSWADFDNKFYEKVTAYKSKGVKVILAIGGWNDSAGDKYSRLVNSPASRARFIRHVLEFIEKHNFDGLDLDWEYPKCWQVDCKKGPESDKPAFASFLRELNAEFKPRGLLLTAAVSPSKTVIDAGYDVPALNKYLDWIAVMTYDFHGHWDKKTGHVAPLYGHPDDDNLYFNSNFSLHYWLDQGADREKIVMGMPLYGQSFSLAEASNNGLNAPTYGTGEAGTFTRAGGFLAYYEICHRVQTKGWTVVRDPLGRMGPYAYKGNQWVSFDDAPMIAKKSQLVVDMKLGGAMIWALDLDDFRNRCECEEHPLLKTINRVLGRLPSSSPLTVKCPLEGKGGGSKIPGTSRPVTITTKWPQQVFTEPSTQPPTVAVVTQPSGGGEKGCHMGQYKSHESDCGKYYECQFDEYKLKFCPAGLHWNKDHCDWPYNSQCQPGSSSASPPTWAPTTKPVTHWTPSTTSTPTSEPVTHWTPSTTSTPTTQPITWWPPPTSSQKPSTVTLPSSSTTPSIVVPDTGYKVVCYFTNWAWYRPGLGKYKPDDIDASLCTHIVYGFAVLNGDSLTIRAHDSWADFDNKFYEKVTAYKSRGIKVLLAIGGWNDSAGDKYSRLVNSPAARARFIQHVLEFLEKHNFDGLDLDWEYPKCWQVDCKKGPESDKPAFAAFLRELSAEFKPRGLLLSSAVSPSKTVIDAGYDVPALNQYLDWIAVMTYDFHGHWDKKTGHVAPLYTHPDDDFFYFNANFSLHYWLDQGADRQKIVMGMPLYGQSFSLADSSNNGLNAPTYGTGEAGAFTRAGGFLAYYEICHLIKSSGWTVVRDPQQRMGPYAYRGNQWVSFDDIDMIRKKSELVRSLGLGGGMIWALDLDDFTNRCSCEPHPLLRTINRVLRNYPIPGPSSSSCMLG